MAELTCSLLINSTAQGPRITSFPSLLILTFIAALCQSPPGLNKKKLSLPSLIQNSVLGFLKQASILRTTNHNEFRFKVFFQSSILHPHVPAKGSWLMQVSSLYLLSHVQLTFENRQNNMVFEAYPLIFSAFQEDSSRDKQLSIHPCSPPDKCHARVTVRCQHDQFHVTHNRCAPSSACVSLLFIS